MPVIELSRFYPATPDETFAALRSAVERLAKFRNADQFARSVSFSTRMSAWASGANISAYVIPRDGGCVVEFAGQAKMRTQINANNAAHRQLTEILDAVSSEIVAARAGC